MIEERAGGHSAEGIQGSGTITTDGNITEMDRGIALTRNAEPEDTVYKRTNVWDEENRLKRTIDSQAVEYRYDSTGERTNKRSDNNGETLYFNSMWLTSEDTYGFRQSKNIYLGETRIATRLNMESDSSTGYEKVNTYYYHPDHLGSSNIVTTPDGAVFEHIEYTPYGESWIENSSDLFDMLPYKFTAKELDDETGLYYYGARYLDPRTSRWISSDPLGADLINPNRKGFKFIESMNWYGYVNNNPVKYVDPTGLDSADAAYSRAKAIDTFNATVYNKDNPLNQKDFDAYFGFGNGKSSKSCQTAALVNSYDGITQKSLSEAVAVSKDNEWLSGDGSPLALDQFSKELATQEGLSSYKSLVYNEEDGYKAKTMTVADAIKSDYDQGIVKLIKPGFTHHVAGFNDGDGTSLVDSLNPGRVGASDYVPKEVKPLQDIPLSAGGE